MERKVKLYIAQTLDGFIADENGDISFLNDYGQNGEDYGYTAFMKTIDTVIMGRKTYEQVLTFEGEYPYKNQKTYVLSSTYVKSDDVNLVYCQNIVAMMHDILEHDGKDIFLIGGAEVIKHMMNGHYIDEIILSIIPKTIGKGIPLFIEHGYIHTFELSETKTFNDGIVQIVYKK